MHPAAAALLCALSCLRPTAAITDAVNKDTLRLVTAVWRHGARSPVHELPLYPHLTGEGAWPRGLGELTGYGERQAYNLGRFLRHRYDGWLAARYDAFQHYIRATDFNRTIASAMLVNAGLYPPLSDDNGNNNDTIGALLGWQPIPVHARQCAHDFMCAPCPSESPYTEELRQSAEYKRFAEEHASYIGELAAKSGITQPPLDVLSINRVFDPLRCIRTEADHGGDATRYRWPDWVTEQDFDMIRRLYDAKLRFERSTIDLQRFTTGALLRDIAERMADRAEDNGRLDTRLRFYGYSAHDSTLLALTHALGVFDTVGHNHFADVLLLELHAPVGDAAVEYNVKLYYGSQNVTAFPHYDVRPLPLSKCALFSPYGVCTARGLYDAYAETLFTDDWRLACGYAHWAAPGGEDPSASYDRLAFMRFLSVLCLALSLALCVCSARWCRLRRFAACRRAKATTAGWMPLRVIANGDGAALLSDEEVG